MLQDLLWCVMRNERGREMVMTTMGVKKNEYVAIAPFTTCIRFNPDGFLVCGVWDFVSAQYIDIGAVLADDFYAVYINRSAPMKNEHQTFISADESAAWIHQALERCTIQPA